MTPERVKQIVADHPWLPQDYRRLLPRIEPGLTRYGVQWLDGPQNPTRLFGPVLGEQFPSALWIGRRQGNALGYSHTDNTPRLCEWARTQKHLIARYDSMDALVLAAAQPVQDRRAHVACAVRVPGLSFGPWRQGHDALDANCIISPGLAMADLPALLDALPLHSVLTLTREDCESWTMLRVASNGLQTRDVRHGSVGTWQPASRRQMLDSIAALAAFNDGSSSQYFARLSVSPP